MFSFCVMVENLRTCKGEVEIRLKEQVQKIQPKSLKILRSIYKRDKKEVWKLVKKKKEERYNMKFQKIRTFYSMYIYIYSPTYLLLSFVSHYELWDSRGAWFPAW